VLLYSSIKCKEEKHKMVNTTRASLMAQIAELKHFNIITGEQEQVMIQKVEDWDKSIKK